MIKDYDLSVHYHPSKANVVDVALSRRYNYRAAVDLTKQRPHMRRFELNVVQVNFEVSLANIYIRHNLLERIKATRM